MFQKQQLAVISVWDWEEVSRGVLVPPESLSAVLCPCPAMQQVAVEQLVGATQPAWTSPSVYPVCSGCTVCKGLRKP